MTLGDCDSSHNRSMDPVSSSRRWRHDIGRLRLTLFSHACSLKNRRQFTGCWMALAGSENRGTLCKARPCRRFYEPMKHGDCDLPRRVFDRFDATTVLGGLREDCQSPLPVPGLLADQLSYILIMLLLLQCHAVWESVTSDSYKWLLGISQPSSRQSVESAPCSWESHRAIGKSL